MFTCAFDAGKGEKKTIRIYIEQRIYVVVVEQIFKVKQNTIRVEILFSWSQWCQCLFHNRLSWIIPSGSKSFF